MIKVKLINYEKMTKCAMLKYTHALILTTWQLAAENECERK